jgi:hypothetical protein
MSGIKTITLNAATTFKRIRLSKDGMTTALMKYHHVPPFQPTMHETLFFIKKERQ